MQHSDKPFEELEKAKQLLIQMKTARTLDELDMFWKNYLTHLDRVWNKAKANFSRSPKWSNWQSPYVKARNKDPLILYLMQARNADEHTTDEITEKREGFMAINPADPKQGIHIKNMRTDARGEIHIETTHPIVFEFEPSRVAMIAFENRKVIYNPPMSHMGEPLDPHDLIGAAAKGIDFYEGFLHSAEAFFVDSSRSSGKNAATAKSSALLKSPSKVM